jgi:hypothetical protein
MASVQKYLLEMDENDEGAVFKLTCNLNDMAIMWCEL